jgi:hypothetical protein
MRPSSRTLAALTLALTLSGALGGCSEYFDHRDAIALNAGDAVASNAVSQMVDPWPVESANRDIAFNGVKMQSAVERYRTNQVTPPNGTGTSATYQAPPAGANNSAPLGPTVNQPAPTQ